MESNDSHLESMKALYKAFIAGDIGPFLGALAEDAVQYTHGDPSTSPFYGVVRGIKEMEAYFGNLSKVELERFEPTAMVESQDKVIVLIDVRRITKATGHVIEGQFVHVWQYAGGKIVRGDVYEAD